VYHFLPRISSNILVSCNFSNKFLILRLYLCNFLISVNLSAVQAAVFLSAVKSGPAGFTCGFLNISLFAEACWRPYRILSDLEQFSHKKGHYLKIYENTWFFTCIIFPVFSTAPAGFLFYCARAAGCRIIFQGFLQILANPQQTHKTERNNAENLLSYIQ